MKKRILFILHLPPPVHGAAMVGKYIHDSKLINEKFDCRYINIAIANSLEDIGHFKLKKIISIFALLKNVIFSVKDFKPNLVYVTPNAKGSAFYKEFLVVQLLKIMRCKVVAHYHNKGVSTKQDCWHYNLLYKKFFKDIKVILLGKSLYNDMKKYVKWDDVRICPNGIPNVSNTFITNDHNPPKLLFLSNLLISKGVFDLLDALKILKDKGCSFVCDFVGGETAEIDAKRFSIELIKRDLEMSVAYCGIKYGDEKHREIGECDIFVLPTHNDCFPLVLLEAMMHGKPCITTDEGAICDIVKDGVNGFIVQKKDCEELAQRIEELIKDDKLRKEIGNKGKDMFLQEFTLTAFESRMYKILTELCS